MNAKFLYEVFEQTEKNHFPDLFLGLAAAQVEHPIPHEKDKAVREFIGQHYDALVKAYAGHDYETFAKAVEACAQKDADEAEEIQE